MRMLTAFTTSIEIVKSWNLLLGMRLLPRLDHVLITVFTIALLPYLQ